MADIFADCLLHQQAGEFIAEESFKECLAVVSDGPSESGQFLAEVPYDALVTKYRDEEP